MNWHLIPLALSGICLVFAYKLIIRDIKAGRTPAVVASWIVWGTGDVLFTAGGIAKGIEMSAILLPMAWAIGCGTVLTAILQKEKFAGFEPIDRLCLALSALGLGAWMLTAINGNAMPELGLLGVILSLTAGCIPTIKEEFLNPGPAKAWSLFLAGSMFDLLAIKSWAFYDVLITIVGIVLQVAIVLSVLLGKARQKRGKV